MPNGDHGARIAVVRPRVRARVALTATVLVVAACGHSTSPERNAPMTSFSTTSSALTTPTTITERTRHAVPACNAPSLDISDALGGGQYQGPRTGTTDQSALDIVAFKNISDAACSLHGYPGLALLNTEGRPAQQAQRVATGVMAGIWPPGLQGVGDGYQVLPEVVLEPGDSASAGVEGTLGNESNCTMFQDFLITPPNDTQSVRVDKFAPISACPSISIEPVVPGTHGRYTPPPTSTATPSDGRADAVLACRSYYGVAEAPTSAAYGYYTDMAIYDAKEAARIDPEWNPLATHMSMGNTAGKTIDSECSSIGVAP